MNTENLLQPLQLLSLQVKNLLALAHAEDWQAVQTQITDYQQGVAILSDENYLQAVRNANLIEEAQALITQIYEFNRLLDENAVVNHDKIASELRHMMQSDKALNAYGR